MAERPASVSQSLESELVKRFQAGTIPPQARLAAAKGNLPCPFEDLLKILYELRNDEDPAIKDAIKFSFHNMVERKATDALGTDRLAILGSDRTRERDPTVVHPIVPGVGTKSFLTRVQDPPSETSPTTKDGNEAKSLASHDARPGDAGRLSIQR